MGRRSQRLESLKFLAATWFTWFGDYWECADCHAKCIAGERPKCRCEPDTPKEPVTCEHCGTSSQRSDDRQTAGEPNLPKRETGKTEVRDSEEGGTDLTLSETRERSIVPRPDTGPLADWHLQRHRRNVRLAAKRAAICDHRGTCDDWIKHYLLSMRRAAVRGGVPIDDVNELVMQGMIAGQEEAAHR